MSRQEQQQPQYSLLVRALAALFYGGASFLIMVVNKNILTANKFSSFQVLGLGQMAATLAVLFVGKRCGVVSFPDLSGETLRKVWPLPLFYMGNMLFGLGGTSELSLPMLTVLRRFSILMTMVAEFYILGYRPRTAVQMSVYAMVGGAVVAASNDLAFNLRGYVYVLMNDVCTAANGVCMKQKLNSKDLGKYGLLFYNSLFMIVPTALLAFLTGEVDEALVFPGWASPSFCLQFALSCVFGFFLMFSTVLCTQCNSPLTTTIIGCLKNILITYFGIIFGDDYVFSWLNFIGLNISVVASLFYTKVTFSGGGGGGNSKTATVAAKPKPSSAADSSSSSLVEPLIPQNSRASRDREEASIS